MPNYGDMRSAGTINGKPVFLLLQRENPERHDRGVAVPDIDYRKPYGVL